jgi:hypothetical protein
LFQLKARIHLSGSIVLLYSFANTWCLNIRLFNCNLREKNTFNDFPNLLPLPYPPDMSKDFNIWWHCIGDNLIVYDVRLSGDKIIHSVTLIIEARTWRVIFLLWSIPTNLSAFLLFTSPAMLWCKPTFRHCSLYCIDKDLKG